MRLREALRLRPGDRIDFLDHARIKYATARYKGEVIFVTPRGGIRVRVVEEEPWYGPAKYARQFRGYETWVPYHFVIQRLNR